MTTRAIVFLKKAGIPHDVVTYDHQEKGAVFAARATAFPLEQTVKTLVTETDSAAHCLALLPGHRQLNLKKLARILGVKRIAMADTATAERLTGYLVGGISPFATRHPLPVVMDAAIPAAAIVMINAGQRGTMLKMAPEDIIRAMACRVADIAR